MKSLVEYIKESVVNENKLSVNWVIGYCNDIVINGSNKKYDGEIFIYSRIQSADGDVKIHNSKKYDKDNTVSTDVLDEAIDKEMFMCVTPKDKKVSEILIKEYGFEDCSKEASKDNAVSIFIQKLADNNQRLVRDILDDNSVC